MLYDNKQLRSTYVHGIRFYVLKPSTPRRHTYMVPHLSKFIYLTMVRPTLQIIVAITPCWVNSETINDLVDLSDTPPTHPPQSVLCSCYLPCLQVPLDKQM